MRSSRIRTLQVLLAAVALFSTACIADDPDPNAAAIEPGGSVEIFMNEFSYRPSLLSFVAGSTAKITLINNGNLPHEFMAGETLAEGGGYDHDLLAVVLTGADGSGFTTAGVTFESDNHDAGAVADEHTDEATTDDHTDEATTDDHTDEAMTDEAMTDEAMTDEEMAAMDGGGHAGHSGAAITVQPGGRVDLEFVVPADATGDWELGCFIDDHYEAGMHGTITVLAPIS